MSVQTETDASIERALNNIEIAVQELSEVITAKAWGYDNYNDKYKEKIRNSFIELVTIRDRLQ